MSTNGQHREPSWKIVGDESLSDEAIDALARLLLDHFGTEDPHEATDRKSDD